MTSFTSSTKQRQRRNRAEGAGAIVQAGLDVLSERGLDALTVAAVAERAGVSVGTLYNRFADKDALVFAMHEAFVAAVASDGGEAAPAATGSLTDVLRELIGEHCRLMRAHEPLMRVFMHLAMVNPDMAAVAAQATQAIGKRFTARLLAHPSVEIKNRDPAFAADVCFELVHDIAARRVSRGGTFESDVELSWERLSEELTQLCRAYLRAPAS